MHGLSFYGKDFRELFVDESTEPLQEIFCPTSFSRRYLTGTASALTIGDQMRIIKALLTAVSLAK